MLNRLEMLRIFVAAAEAGSFKEAAVRLGTSPQAVTRAVQELERAQGELLFHRNTRQVRITAFGEQLAARAKLGVQQLDELFASRPDQEASELNGIVRVTAPKALGRIQVQPVLAEIASRHPQLRFDLHLSDVPADVVDEKIDIGVRFGFLRDSRYVARRVATHAFHVVGSPALIARVGHPASVSQLDHLPTTVMHDIATGRPWPWLFAGGQQFTPARPAFSSNDSEAERDAVLAGLAFGQLAGFLADAHIAEGRLVPVLQEQAPDPWELYVYRPQRGPVPPRIRLVYDRLVEALSAMRGTPSPL
nr:LysR family transcriptional regulator [uncultured Ralstonia sp.]